MTVSQNFPSFENAPLSASSPVPAFSSFYLELRAAADALGIDDFGFAPIGDAATFEIFADAVRRGATGGLAYLENDVEARRSPLSVSPTARTLIVVVLSQARLRRESQNATATLFESLDALQADANPPFASSSRSNAAERGALVEYGVALDYHDVLRRTLKRLQTFFRTRFPNATTRAAVDTAPLLEKDWAVRAGLGFCGLHSLLTHRRFGSRLFLGELLVSTPFVELTGFSTPETFQAARDATENPIKRRVSRDDAARCATCRRCVDACPTGALVGDRTLDARRCLNFWTIENRAEIPQDIAARLDGRLFGCDECQRVCPWNAAPDARGATPKSVDLAAVDALDETTFRAIFKKTPIFRARLDGLRRVAETIRRENRRRTPPRDERD